MTDGGGQRQYASTEADDHVYRWATGLTLFQVEVATTRSTAKGGTAKKATIAMIAYPAMPAPTLSMVDSGST